MDPTPEQTDVARRTERQAALAAALLPVVSRALEARRGPPVLVAWVEEFLLREGGADAGRRATAGRVAAHLSRLVSEGGFDGTLHEQLVLTIRAQRATESRPE